MENSKAGALTNRAASARQRGKRGRFIIPSFYLSQKSGVACSALPYLSGFSKTSMFGKRLRRRFPRTADLGTLKDVLWPRLWLRPSKMELPG